MEFRSMKLDPFKDLPWLPMLKSAYDQPSLENISSAEKVSTEITKFIHFIHHGCWISPWH